MNQSHPPNPVYGSALEALEGEVLPERAALSVLAPNMADTTSSVAAPHSYVVSDGHGGTVSYACQTTTSPGSQGLIGLIGLGSAPYSTTTCVPAAVTSH